MLRYVKTKRFGWLICIFSFFISVFVFAFQPNRQGLGLFFTLPLTWSICSFVFQDIIDYHKHGFGLKIFYLVTIIRYLVLPILTCISGDISSPYGFFSSNAYLYAIIIQDVELIVSCITIKLYYQKTYDYYKILYSSQNAYYDDVSVGGLVIILLSVAIIAYRGADRLLRTFRFGIVKQSLDSKSMYGYDIWLAHTLMAIIVIIVIGKFQKANDKKESFINTIIPLICVGLSCVSIFGNNRMMLIYFAVSGIATLQFAFPQKRKFFMFIIIPILLIVLIGFTMVKQFRVDINSNSQFSVSSFSEIIAAYVTGTESIAKTYHMYGINGDQVQLLTPIADLVNKTTIFQLPGINVIIEIFKDVPTTYKLGTIRSEIIPVAGQTLYLGGESFGWLLDILAYYFVVRLLIISECKSKTAIKSGDVYIFTWISAIFGMAMCYSLAVIYNSLVYVPLFASLALYIVRNIRLIRAERKSNQ